MLRSAVFSIAALSAFVFSAAIQADPAEGRWVTIDDEDGSQASVVEIRITEQGLLQGTIVELLREDDRGKTCEKCPDDFKDQPIEGLTFMWDLENDGEGQWRSGRILDPKSGSIYKSKLDVSEDGQSLEVRGYIGVSWLGRSQQWLRYQPEGVATTN
ncbi:signal peptidase [Bacterioplanes sanyensis]|uniref:Signal peptidase n=1 Tax=Bacterioplanes sanyensis TaxID=1249553 RepID=A0A222FM32_9GAMM|nr:DUF2147 domain-containing protein [Bacterioplanes sanyensis]ASP39283.1 signal peptidase [Bacterioplanes sanyensis]